MLLSDISIAMTLSPDASPGYLVNHLARLFAAGLQKRIRPLGLSTGVFPIMLHLWENDGLTQRELVQRVGIEQATMANTLARMERDGLVHRRPDPTDGRVKRTWLTDLGRSLNEAAIRAAREENQKVLSALSQTERTQLLALLRKAIQGLEA